MTFELACKPLDHSLPAYLFDIPVVRVVRREGVAGNKMLQTGTVGEETGQVRGQNTVLDVAQNCLVLGTSKLAEYIMSLL